MGFTKEIDDRAEECIAIEHNHGKFLVKIFSKDVFGFAELDEKS